MPTFKNITDSYTITSPQVVINGNLFVTGNSQQVVSTNSAINDHLIVLNHGLSPTSSAPNPLGAAIEVDRGWASANVQLRWTEFGSNIGAWQITNDGSTYANIAVSSATGGINLTANLDTKAYTIYSSTSANITFDDNVAIQNTTITPTAVSGYNVVYSQTPSGGGSGLYVTNTTITAQELATQAAAIKYAIIFG
jgi:hypothetical protein